MSRPENQLSVHEVRAARQWWDRRGRQMVNKAFNADDTQAKIRTSTAGAPAIKTTEIIDPKLPSGILAGLPFSQLSGEEQQRVCYVWRYMNEREKYPERINERDERHIKRLHLN